MSSKSGWPFPFQLNLSIKLDFYGTDAAIPEMPGEKRFDKRCHFVSLIIKDADIARIGEDTRWKRDFKIDKFMISCARVGSQGNSLILQPCCLYREADPCKQQEGDQRQCNV